GEGMAPVAAYLNEQPIVIGAPTVASSYHRVLQAHLDGSALPIERVGFADYLVPYVNTLQRGLDQDILGVYLHSQTPEFAVWHNGIEYARVYRGPHYPVAIPLDRQIAEMVLVEALVAPGSLVIRPQEAVDVLLRWRGSLAPTSGPVVVRLEGADGRSIASVSRRLGEDGQGGHRGGAADQAADLHSLAVPRTAPLGPARLIATFASVDVVIEDILIQQVPGP
ncbi:MAG: hypothetical protein ACKVVP_17650, partial [Chloroflexota bacterium]